MKRVVFAVLALAGLAFAQTPFVGGGFSVGNGFNLSAVVGVDDLTQVMDRPLGVRAALDVPLGGGQFRGDVSAYLGFPTTLQGEVTLPGPIVFYTGLGVAVSTSAGLNLLAGAHFPVVEPVNLFGEINASVFGGPGLTARAGVRFGF
ncbi:hypothetical protein [Marinithermus hydrothermalis]|uniref:Outer membrane protein beta-barrel domain-containing protein n=1 Tax=Marinithermus hydrothermalis (strain DSM 14884 / JCM 11576 / T1) TaxID=869210 RepID=F2NPI8_MARHT|nr:hypothetical protein [Marinithermus hydrothermalis]AEB12489.1 hypothetical protein Marky_1754 [Marinithermus hydrothermalis DSM 14884]